MIVNMLLQMTFIVGESAIRLIEMYWQRITFITGSLQYGKSPTK